MKTALEQLKSANLPLSQLTAVVAERDGADAAIAFAAELQKLIHLGWICHSVLPFATAIPIAENYSFSYPDLPWPAQTLTLSRFAYLHQENQQFVLESPRSKSKIVLLDWRVTGLIAKLAQSHQEFSVDDFVDIQLDTEVVHLLLHLLIATEMIDVAPEDSTVTQWRFHNLLFHRRTRSDRWDDSRKSKIPIFEERDRYCGFQLSEVRSR